MTAASIIRNPVILMPKVSTCIPGSEPSLTALIDELGARLVKAVQSAGGQVVTYDYAKPPDISLAIEACDGVLLPGGGDVDPSFYGGVACHPQLYNVDREADRAAIALAQRAAEAGKPILAICRGLQILNVACGGTLVEHMEPSSVVHRGGPEIAMVDHPVTLDQNTLLAHILGKTEVIVRSGHHQAINSLGKGLNVIGRAADGTIEAVVDETGQALGVQWHPEEVSADPQDQSAIFTWLIDAARSGRSGFGRG